MNKYISTLALCSILGLATGCKLEAGSGQYISQERHNEMLGDEDVKPGIAKAALAKTYVMFQEYNTSHDDGGLKAFHLFTDLMCEDVAYTNTSWFKFDYQIGNSEANYRRTRTMWRLFYK